jgi:hypothetical protein
MNNKVVLSGDIIAFTSLSAAGKTILENELKLLFAILEDNFSVFGRIIKGDYLEMVVENPEDALIITLAIKSFIKSISLDENLKDNRYQSYKENGIRIAMGYGELSRYDKENGIIDGPAIYFSGRKINEERTTYNRERIVIKNTLYFVSEDEKLNENVNVILGLIDFMINNATGRQCEILFNKLIGLSEDEIAKKLNVKQPAINKHSTSIGWNAIDKAVKYYSSLILNQQ